MPGALRWEPATFCGSSLRLEALGRSTPCPLQIDRGYQGRVATGVPDVIRQHSGPNLPAVCRAAGSPGGQVAAGESGSCPVGQLLAALHATIAPPGGLSCTKQRCLKCCKLSGRAITHQHPTVDLPAASPHLLLLPHLSCFCLTPLCSDSGHASGPRRARLHRRPQQPAVCGECLLPACLIKKLQNCPMMAAMLCGWIQS